MRESTVPSLNEFDETCRVHDVTLANTDIEEEWRQADAVFFSSNVGKGLKRTTAAYLVKHINPLLMAKKKSNGNLRGSQSRIQQTRQPKANASGMAPGRPQGNDTVRYAPVASATRRTGMAPVVQTRGGLTTIAHRSFLSPVGNESAYTVNSYAVNPGLSQTFPWLHRVARRYEEYRFKRLRFSYRSVTATSTPGVIMLSFDYDAADATPTSKQSQAQTIPNAESNVWTNIDLVVPTGTIPWKYVRAGILSSNLDIKTYDAGQFLISSLYGTGAIGGELYVEYEVELRKPTEGPIGGCTLGFSPASITAPFAVANPLSTVGISPLRVLNPTTLEFVSSGEWYIYFWYTGSGLTVTFPTPTFVGEGAARTPSAFTATNSTGSAYRALAVRSLPGDTIQVPTLSSGTPVAFVLTVSLIDYESVS